MRRHGAERSGLPRKGRVPQSEAAGWACARFPQPGLGRNRGPGAFRGPRGSSRSRAARPHRAGAGGREVCGLLSPDVRRRRPLRPERAPWGPRSPWRWAPSTTWHFSCNSAAPRGPPATRPGTITSPATVSWVAAPADFPTKPHPGPRGSNLAVLGLEPAPPVAGVRGGAPPAASADRPWLPGHSCGQGCTSRATSIHSRGHIHLHDQPRTHSHARCLDRKSTRLNSSHRIASRMPSSA